MRRLPTVIASLAALLLAGFPSVVAAQDNPTVVRRSGEDRFATAAAISADAFAPGVADVWIATGRDFPDALAIGPVAGTVRPGPVLLVTRTTIPDATAAELRRLDPATITVLGGPNAVGSSVVNELRQYTDGVVRQFNEADRFATAARVARELKDRATDVSTVIIATGRGFADALGGGAAGAALAAPLLLVEQDRVPDATAAALTDLQPDTLLVLGGNVAIKDSVVASLRDLTGAEITRLAGDDRYDTAAQLVALAFPQRVGTVYLATGQNFPDALAATPAAAFINAPLLITRPDCLPGVVADQLDRLAPDRVVVLGGTNIVSDAAAGGDRCDGAPPGPIEVRRTVVTDQVDVPWDITFTPDGRIFTTERDTGRVLEVSGAATSVHTTFAVNNAGEGGLLGLTHSPTFAEDGWLYVYFTTDTDNRIVRFKATSPTATRQIILSGIPRASNHDAGRIEFGPDGKLYVGTGDAGNVQAAQDINSLAGKILRLEADGSTPSDNPFGNGVWAYGFRDPQGLTWDGAGRMFATEFGPDRDDEINRVIRGGNYAWGSEPGGATAQPTGVTGDDRFQDPIVVKQPAEASWSGLTALVGGSIPQWEGDLFVAALRGQRVWRIDLDSAGNVVGTEAVITDLGRMRHAAQAPDGSLWLLTSNEDGRGSGTDAIHRLGP